jgi:hypothetical protein
MAVLDDPTSYVQGSVLCVQIVLDGLLGVRGEAHEGSLAVRRNHQFSELDVKSKKHSDSDLSYCAETMMLNERETRIFSKTHQLKRGTTQDARLGR